MKKFVIALMALAGSIGAAQAEVADITVSYGGYTQMDATDCHNGGGKVNNAWGALNAGVNFNIAPNFTLGPSYTFSSASRKHHSSDKFYYHALMLNGRYSYFSNSIVRLYGHVGMGAVISHESAPEYSDNHTYFAYQISPLGAVVDLTPKVSLFGEVGFGAQGLLQVGLKFNL